MNDNVEYKGYTLVKAGETISTLYVTLFPDRKLPSLAIGKGSELRVLGHFSRAETAQEFMQWMDCITHKETP
jgi:hypothetical protein